MALSSTQTAEIQKQYDPMRRRLQTQEAANLQSQKDALARRAAQMGGGPSGAFIKQEALANDAFARRLQDGNEAIDAQQAAEARRVAEVQEGRDFARQERLGGQEFASKQSALDRMLQRSLQSESLGLQRYGIDVNKGLQEGQLTGIYGGKDTFAKTMADKQHDLAVAGLTGSYNGQTTLAGKAQNMAQAEFNQNVLTNKINTIFSGINAKLDPKQINALVNDLDSMGVSFDEDGNVSFSGDDVYIENIVDPNWQRPGGSQPQQQAQLAQGASATAAPKQGDFKVGSNGKRYRYDERLGMWVAVKN